MRDFLIPFAVALAWLALWAIALRLFGLFIFKPTPEEHAARRERIRQMGKLRYTLIFGVLGFGFPVGLAIAVRTLIANKAGGWGGAAVGFVLLTASGWMFGIRQWNESFRGEVPFPPPFPPQK